ncbi:MAG: hypothetical protein QOG10_6333 [Kribbellaceae bacterium]|jgi:hypothetical protein|nr:hypothetical protein [Kribbellaceae bacterium]
MTVIRGYFKFDHGDAPVRISTPEQIDQFIDALMREPFENSVAAMYVDGRTNDKGYTDHELLLAVNERDQVGALRYLGDNGSFYATGEMSRYDEVTYYYMGSDRGFPRDSDVPIDAIRQAAKDFLTYGGERPPSMRWSDWPADVA